MRVRQAGAGDFAAWSRMREALWPEDTAAGHHAELEKAFPNPKFKGFIAEVDGKDVAFAEAYLRDYADGCDSQPVVFLEGIWVDERHRRQGLARRLLEAVEAWAREMGIPEIGSNALADNRLSHLCHAHWGFEETEKVVYFRKKLA